MTFDPVFYSLPPDKVKEGMSTEDGQDVLWVDAKTSTELIFIGVYTPRSDDLKQDEANRADGETRWCARDKRFDLAVFEDTNVDGTELPEAGPPSWEAKKEEKTDVH